MNLFLTYESRDTLKSFTLFLFVKTSCGTQRQVRNINFKNYPLWFTFSTQRRIWSFHVVVLKRMAKKCTYGLLTKCEVKMAGYWPSSFYASLWTETKSRSINSQKKNEANIQPS